MTYRKPPEIIRILPADKGRTGDREGILPSRWTAISFGPDERTLHSQSSDA